MSILDVPGVSKAQLEKRLVEVKADNIDARDSAQAFSIDALSAVIESHSIVLQAPLDATAAALEEVKTFEQQIGQAEGAEQVGAKLKNGQDGTVQDALDEIKTPRIVDSYGADPTGVTDSTAAFLAAGIGAYVPKGYYLVDSMVVDINQYNGPGTIYTTGGQTISLDHDPLSTHFVQRKVVELKFGFDGRPVLTDTQIYPSAQNAPQGLAIDRDPVTGQRFFYTSQGVGGTSWASDEVLKICKWAYREDGGPQVVDTIGATIRSSHAHLSTLRENGKLYMYQSATTPLDAINATSEAGKGWSKMEWKGANNVDADVISYNVWGRPGSGHRYQNYGKGCVQVSQDGRYMILIGINYSGGAGGRTLFVYDRKQVESMADPLKAEPVFVSHSLTAIDNDAETAYQGETSDGKYVYICWGSGSVYARRGVTIYTLGGEKLRDIVFEGPAHMYTDDEIRNGHPAYGWAMSFEAEGIAIQGDSIHVTFMDYWRKQSMIVTYMGQNYVNTSSSNTGNRPNTSPLSWRPTDRPATHGDWVSTTTYTFLGSENTRRTKVVYAIQPRTGDARELPCTSRYMFPFSVGVTANSASELLHTTVPLGSAYTAAQHNVVDDTYRLMFRYSFDYSFDVRDCRDGSDNSIRGIMRTSAIIGGDHTCQLGCGDGTSAGGAFVTAYSATSASVPGALRLATAAIPGAEMRFSVGGATKLNILDAETVTYQSLRPSVTGTDDIGNASRFYRTIRALNFALGNNALIIDADANSPEGVKTAAIGSLYIDTVSGRWWRKATGAGNTGWVLVA